MADRKIEQVVSLFQLRQRLREGAHAVDEELRGPTERPILQIHKAGIQPD